MANHKSAEKRVRQTKKRTLVNNDRRSRIRTSIKSLLKLIEAKDKDKAYAQFRKVESEIRKGVSKGVSKKETSSRKISRLSAYLKKSFAKAA